MPQRPVQGEVRLNIPGAPDLRADDVFDRIEKLLVDEYRRGGLTAHAKQAIDRGLDAVQEALGSTSVPPPAPPEGDPPGR